MDTIIEKVNPCQPDEKIMEQAGKRIAAGELVAFPTETVYGLGGDALRPEAAAKIYAAKGRPSDNPLIVHIADFSDMERVAREVPAQAKKLADAFWPGPLTMIVWKSDEVPSATTGGMDTVAVRMPNHPVALELIRKSGCLIAAPSANTSGRPSPTEAKHVAEDLSGRIAMILDGGPVGIGIESTIIDLTEKKPMVLRPGYITPKMLSDVLGQEVVMDPGIIAADDTTKPKAPGMKYKHYAPKADMVIVDGEETAVIAKINELTKQRRTEGKKVAVIATEETRKHYHADVVLCIGKRSDEDAKQQLRSVLEQQKLYGMDVMDVRSPLFQPRDRKGMPIPEEVWKWNYVMTVISKKVSEQEFRDVFSNLKLISYKPIVEPPCHHTTELIVQIPSRELYDVLESPEYVALLQEPLRYIFNEFKLMYKLPPVS